MSKIIFLNKIVVDNIRVYAYHGCLKEETIIGSDYSVTIQVTANLTPASHSDDLTDTVDYVLLNRIVKEEMKIPSKLLEHVCQRIIQRIFIESPLVQSTKVSVSKLNPPIEGDVAQVTVVLKAKRT